MHERRDIQRLLRENIAVIAPDTLVIAEEYGEWDDSRRRIDLLGIDRDANLVVIELKRTEDGGHNGEKSGKWPSEYYSDKELRELSIRTGVDYKILCGSPHVNPLAIGALGNKMFVDQLLAKYAAYIEEIIRARNRIIRMNGFDFFSVTPSISRTIVDHANSILPSTIISEEPDTGAQ